MMRSPSMASDPRGQRVTILTHCKSQRIGLSEWQGFRANLPSTAWCTHLPFWIWSACRFCLVFHVGRNDDRVPALSVWVFSPWQEMLGGKNRHQHEALKGTAPKAIEWQTRKNHEKTHIFVGQELRPSHSVFFDGILHRWRSQGHVGMASCTFKTISLTHHQLPNSLVAVVNIMQRVVRLIFGRWIPKKTYSASSGADRKLWIGFIRCWPKYEAKKLINV